MFLSLTPGKVWVGFFALWGIFLSGAFASVGGPPGVIQAVKLRAHLAQRSFEVAKLESQLDILDEEAGALKSSKTAQHREIRKVLGYAAPDELIFDFSAAERL